MCFTVQPRLQMKLCHYLQAQSPRRLRKEGLYNVGHTQGGHLWLLRHEHQWHKWASMLDKGEHGRIMCMSLLVFHSQSP